MVPMAEERRPEKGTASGERPHCALMLIRPTMLERASTRGAAASAEAVKREACWPFHESRSAACTYTVHYIVHHIVHYRVQYTVHYIVHYILHYMVHCMLHYIAHSVVHYTVHYILYHYGQVSTEVSTTTATSATSA